MLNITNRRYIGSKRKLVERIYKKIDSLMGTERYVVADLFAGTGSIGERFLTDNKAVIMNDTLLSNVITYRAWFGKGAFSTRRINQLLEKLNRVDAELLSSNYFSQVYGGKYFHVSDAKKIGYIRDYIERCTLKKRERDIILSSLMYATDKIANTVGHYEHYLNGNLKKRNLHLEPLNIVPHKTCKSIYNMDANKLVRKIKCDVAYIDPPYNGRQYVNFYHVLENLVRWEKPKEFEGVSMKFKRDALKSDYSRAKAPSIFEDLVQNIDAKLIVVSYNNTFSAKSSASNNKITENQILSALKERGVVSIEEMDHAFFNSGKTDFKNHKEMLYICKVT